MDDIELVHLFEIEDEKIIELMNNEQVGKQMPLLANGFSAEDCKEFLKAKRKLWDEFGYGSWAFLIKGEFAGWEDYGQSMEMQIFPRSTL